MRVVLALHTSDARRAIGSSSISSSHTSATQEIYTVGDALRASWWCGKDRRNSANEKCVGSRHRTKRIANNSTSVPCEAVVRFGSGKPKLFADGVGVNLGEAVSANSTPAQSSGKREADTWGRVKEVDVALVVAVATGEGDSSGCRRSRSHSMVNLSQLKRGREGIVDRRHDSLRQQIFEDFAGRGAGSRDESSFFPLMATQDVGRQLKVHLGNPQGFALLLEVGANLGNAHGLEEARHHVVRARYRSYTWRAVGMCTTPQLFSRFLSSDDARLQRSTATTITSTHFSCVGWST